MAEGVYRHLTYDLTLAAAQSMLAVNDQLTFCYVSGTGTDTTERGSMMWGRVKGATENALLRLGFKAAYMFRPGFIQPLKGVRSRPAGIRRSFGRGSAVSLYQAVAPRYVTTTEAIGRAMIRAVVVGPEADSGNQRTSTGWPSQPDRVADHFATGPDPPLPPGGAEPPRNSLRPSVKVKFLPTPLLVPSFAR